MKKYKLVAMGGTFDIIHIGHLTLLKKSFEIGPSVIIGVTSDNFAKNRLNKNIHNSYENRVENLKKIIEKEINQYNYTISKLENEFGPSVISYKVDCLVVSNETAEKGKKVNYIREQSGLQPIDIISIRMILSEDGLPISSTRIRNKEIDTRGNKVSK